jgi:hypothetical protein
MDEMEKNDHEGRRSRSKMPENTTSERNWANESVVVKSH